VTNQEARQRIIALLRSLVEQELPGSTIDFNNPLGREDTDGFGVAFGDTLTLVWTAITDQTWWLMISGCVAPGFRDVDLSLKWVNEKNSDQFFGKYYCKVNRERGVAAIFYTFNMFGPEVEEIARVASDTSNPSLMNAMASNVFTIAQISSQEGDELRRTYGGPKLNATTEHLGFLFLMLTG
jgi:hypothetical protein